MQAALADRAGERAHHVVLAQHLGGRLRPVPAVQGLVLLLVRHSLPLRARGRSPHGEDRCGRAPAVDHGRLGRFLARQLQPGIPTAPARLRLRLLPSGPDRVRGLSRVGPDLQRPVPRAAPDLPGLGRGFSPAEADRGLQGTAGSPPSTATRGVYAGRPTGQQAPCGARHPSSVPAYAGEPTPGPAGRPRCVTRPAGDPDRQGGPHADPHPRPPWRCSPRSASWSRAGVAGALADPGPDCGEQIHGTGPDATVSYTMCPGDPGLSPEPVPGPQVVEPTPGMTNVRARPFDTAASGQTTAPSRSTSRAASSRARCWTTCASGIRRRPSSITLFEGSAPNAGDVACIEIAVQKQVVITLDEPLAARDLIDGVAGGIASERQACGPRSPSPRPARSRVPRT